jgi:hypothetical protein
MRYQPAKTPETVIFLHILKTAGTTLDQILLRQFPSHQIYATGLISQQGVARFQNMSEAERSQYRLVKGHMTFGIHEYIAGPWAYFTFFREPIERTISHFYYIRRSPDHPSYNFIHENQVDLKQCLELGWADPMLYNSHTRLLSDAWAKVPPGECTEEHLQKAKANLSRIKVVGLTEQFDTSLLLLGRAFGWKHLYYSRQNVTADRPSQRNLSPETMAAVQAANRLDIELYDYATALFAEQVRQQGPDFAQMVNQFQFRNRFVTPLIALYQEMRKISVRVLVRQQIARIRR